MRLDKRLLALLLCAVMLLANVPATVYAAEGESNITLSVDKTEVSVGDTITVTLGYTDMKVKTFTAGIAFDSDLLECVSIVPCDPEYPEDFGLCTKRGFTPGSISTIEQANENGKIGFGVASTNDVQYVECILFVATFEAKSAGEAKITSYEDSDGTDAFRSSSVEVKTVTIKGNEPECEHKNTTAVPNNDGTHNVVCECGEVVSENVACSGGTADCENAAVCEYCGNAYGEAKGHGKTNGFRYVHNDGADTHNVVCADCDKTVEENVACTFEEGSHVCKFACGNETGCEDKSNDDDHDCDVCGKEGITDCTGGTATCLTPAVCSECGEEYGEIDSENHVGDQTTSYTDNGADHTVTVTCECGGEISSENEAHNYGDDFICDNCEHELSGWVEMNGNWYYVVDGEAVTGNVRVPYHKAYAPNADDVAYASTNEDSEYTDATTAVFVFDENGVFQSDFTGIIDGNRYAVNGVIAWHVGLVEVDGEYYYFIGDVNGGGNIAAEGDTYLTRINGIAGFEAKEVYNFAGGKLSGLDGLVDRYGDGKLYYYENSKLMLGNGLTECEDGYIYVRSNGQIAVGKYWVAKTNGICDPGMYTFDENGYLQSAKDPTVNGLVDGIYYKNGMPYYAGLIEIDGDIYYINSAGEAVTGTYYITKVDNYTGGEYKRGDKLTFDADGKLIIE